MTIFNNIVIKIGNIIRINYIGVNNNIILNSINTFGYLIFFY